MQKVQLVRTKGADSKEAQETKRKQKTTKTRPIPTDLMDPDQANTPGALD